MKVPKFIILAVVIFILAVIIVGYKACKIGGHYAELKAAYDEAKKITDADHGILVTTIQEQENKIDNLTKQIAIIIANSHKPTPAEVAKDKELAELRKSWINLSDDCQAKLHELDKAWSDKFNLTVQRYEGDIFTLNATWQKKFDAQVIISDSWHKDRDNEHALRILAEKAMGAADTKIRTLQFTGKLKWGLSILGMVIGHFVWK